MATSTITIPVQNVTVGDSLLLGDDTALTVHRVTPDSGGRVLDLGDGRDMYFSDSVEVRVVTPRPHRYAVKTVTSPSTGSQQAFVIIDLHNQARLAMDVDGEPRTTFAPSAAAMWRDTLNGFHQMGIEL